MRPLLTMIAVFAALVTAAVQPGTADAATLNWLHRPCNHSSRTVSCVEPVLDVDSITAHRSLVFHDASGKHITVSTRAAVWSLAKRHSVKCSFAGGQHDLAGCYGNDRQTGLGRYIVLPDGMSLTLTFFHR